MFGGKRQRAAETDMAAPDLLLDGPDDAPSIVVLAHGAGAPMDSPFMDTMAGLLGERGHRVARFEFPYMAARREDGKRRPPSSEKRLRESWLEVIAHLRPGAGSLVIGGKSLGGRIATLVADEAQARGVVCLGYPFHPPGKPERTRTAHLEGLRTPALVCQGTRDPFGTREEVAGYALASTIAVHWLEDGDHGFKPRKASGRTEAQNIAEAAQAIDRFVRGLEG